MYLLTYEMMVGIVTRDAKTAKEATVAYDEILAAGASMITIRGEDGILIDISALRLIAQQTAPPRRGWGRLRF